MKSEDIKIGKKYKNRLFKDVTYFGVGLRGATKIDLVIVDAPQKEELGLIVYYSKNEYARSFFFDNLYEI